MTFWWILPWFAVHLGSEEPSPHAEADSEDEALADASGYSWNLKVIGWCFNLCMNYWMHIICIYLCTYIYIHTYNYIWLYIYILYIRIYIYDNRCRWIKSYNIIHYNSIWLGACSRLLTYSHICVYCFFGIKDQK